MRNITPLNFDWTFYKKGDSDTERQIVDIPHSNVVIPLGNFNEKIYQFESVYKKKIQIDIKTNKKYYLKFEGVLHQAKLLVNDQLVGTHHNGYTAFEYEITNQVIDGVNDIKVEVDSRETLNQPPFGSTIDYLTYGGIYREVYLIEKDVSHITNVSLKSINLLKEPTIEIVVDSTFGKEVLIEIYDGGNRIISSKGDANETIKIKYPFTLWELDNPKLYEIVITLDEVDQERIVTGFRQAVFKKNGFYLNGKHIKISGLNRHQIYPYVGYAMPKSAQESDARILKKLGNAVRTSHYPQSKHFLNECDRLGILVFTEAAGWQHVGDQAWKERFLSSVGDMILEHQHHPSIILWGVRVNESGDFSDLYNSSNKLARTLDDRQTGGVRCFGFSEQLEDVYTYNDFFHNGRNGYLKDLDEIIDGDIPYLITEFNGHMHPTKSFDSPERQIELAMRYAHIINAYMGDERISGGFGWQFIDYYTHKEFGSGDNICYHGVLDIFRLPKPAARIYESQEAKEPYMEMMHSVNIGDYDGGYIDKFYIATNCEHIDLYQDERYISRFYPEKDTFPNLKHPPVIIDDLYGDAYQNLGISKETAEEYKNIARDVAKRGGMDKLTKNDDIDEDKLQTAWEMYGKYVANWGGETFSYRLIGSYMGNTIERKVGPYESYDYVVKADNTTLSIDETYDVSRVSIEAIDNIGNLRSYAFDAFEVITEGAIEVIGNRLISLIGGRTAVWVKTVSEGKGKLIVKNNKSTTTIDFVVKN